MTQVQIGRLRRVVTRGAPLAAILIAAAAAAQAPADSAPTGRRALMGASYGRAWVDEESLGVVSIHSTWLRAGRAAADLTIATPPRALSDGVFVLGADLGFGVARESASAVLLATLGGGLLAALGEDAAEARPGIFGGVTAVLPVGANTGLRVDLRRHYFYLGSEFVGLNRLEAGVTSLGRRKVH